MDRRRERLGHLEQLHRSWTGAVPLESHLAAESDAAGALLERLPPGSLVINATGMGKDTPGSPLPDGALFPVGGYVWELNYRGDLVFLDQARAQEAALQLQVEDGWTYFIHGWTQVIAEVFDIEIPVSGPEFDAIAADILHQIAQDGEGRDRLDLLLRQRREGRQQERQRRAHESTPIEHRFPPDHASRCRPGNNCRSNPPTLPKASDTA